MRSGFSRAQKWDLVRMSAAAVASTIFFTVPLFLVRSNGTAERTAQSPPTDSTPAAAATNLASAPAPSAQIAPPPTVPNTVSVVTATEFAVESTPALQSARAQSVRPRTPGERPSVLRARANVTAEPSAASFKHRLARFFSGVGKYTVKPFPTVTNSGN
jgi:hypothetical protein